VSVSDRSGKRETDQIRIGYRVSIWFFSILLIIMIAVFGGGAWINIHKLERLWDESTAINFNNVSTSIALSISQQLGDFSSWSELIPRQIRARLLKQQLNILDRIYLVNNDTVYVLYPELSSNLRLSGMTPIREIWAANINSPPDRNAVYTSHDDREVMAKIFSSPANSNPPRHMIVIERDTIQRKRIQQIISFLDIFLFTGLAGCIVIVVFYANRIIQPFKRLEETLDGSSRFILEDDFVRHEKDPVIRLIAMFQSALEKLKDREALLEELNLQLENQSRRKEEVEEHLLSSVNSGILTMDAGRRITTMTSRIPKLLNLKEKDLAGRTCDESFGANNLICELLTECLRDRRVHRQRQWKWELPGNPTKWLSISTTLLRGDFNTVIGAGFIFRDITAWKLMEEQMHEKEHLAALGEMSAGIAHEIRNPLAVLQGNINLLTEEIREPEKLDIIREMQNELISLDRIVRDFLRFAKPTNPQVAIVDLKRLLEEFSEEFKQEAPVDVTINIRAPKYLPAVQIDDSLFRQVLTNLFYNAVQAMKENKTIDVSLEVLSESGEGRRSQSQVIMKIHDWGVGIDPAIKDSLFKPFVTTRSHGTGLGLAIVKKLVLLHNGFIEFEESEVMGTTVRISLPVDYDPDKTQDLKALDI